MAVRTVRCARWPRDAGGIIAGRADTGQHRRGNRDYLRNEGHGGAGPAAAPRDSGLSGAGPAQCLVLGRRSADGAVVLFVTCAVVLAADQFGDSGLGIELRGGHAGREIYLARRSKRGALGGGGAGVRGRRAGCRRLKFSRARTLIRERVEHSANSGRRLLSGVNAITIGGDYSMHVRAIAVAAWQ